MNNPGSDGVAQPGAGSAAAPPAFRPQVLRSVRMRPVLTAVVALVVFAVVAGLALMQKPVYSAGSLVSIDPAGSQLGLDGSAANFDSSKMDSQVAAQMGLIQRPDVLTAAVASLPESTWKMLGATPQIAVVNLKHDLKAERVATSNEISISLKGTDAAKTAAIVNAVTTSYLDAVRKATATESDQRAQLLTEERERVQTELQTARAEQTALGASIGVANPSGDGGNPYDMQLAGIRTQLVDARAAHDAAAAQLAALSGQGPAQTSGLTAAADELIASDAALSSMRASVSARRATLNSQMSGMKPDNPIYQQDQEELADLERSEARMTADLRGKAERRLQDKLRSELERTGSVEARLNAELARQIASATTAAPKLQRATELGADMTRLEAREAAVEDAMRGLRMASSGPGVVRLELAAEVPQSPEPSRAKLLLLLALPLALAIAAIVAAFARKQDRRIFTGGDLGEVVGFMPLAVLPARAEVSDWVYDEYVLRVAAGIESAYRSNGARTFLLTAVSLNSDITPLVSALSRKFRDIGVKVAVASASEMLHETGDTHELDPVHTSGEHRKAIEIWSEGFVAGNIARIKHDNGLVLIEAEPILNCGQTEYVARASDAIILMVESGVTTRDELLEAASLLSRLNVNGVGAVLEELHLRFGDASFRNAIDALERRQSRRSRDQRDVVGSAPLARRETRGDEPVAAAELPSLQHEADAAESQPTPQQEVVRPPFAEAAAPPEEIATAPEVLAVAPADHPAVPEDVPVVQAEIPVLHEAAPVTHEEVPVVHEEAAETPQEIPVDLDLPSLAHEWVPALHHAPINLLHLEADDHSTDAYHPTPLQESADETSIEKKTWELPAIRAAAQSSADAVLLAEQAPPVAVPVVAAVEVPVEDMVQDLAATGTTRRGFAVSGPGRPVLVEDSDARENFGAEPRIASGGEPAREKIAPKLSVRRRAAEAVGDPGMTRKSSWFGRLLGRKDEPVVSIIPDNDDEDEVEANAPRISAAGRSAAQKIADEQEAYERPLANRIEQISRSHSIAAPRLQIVPQHETAIVPEVMGELAYHAPAAAEPAASEPAAVEPLAQEPAEFVGQKPQVTQPEFAEVVNAALPERLQAPIVSQVQDAPSPATPGQASVSAVERIWEPELWEPHHVEPGYAEATPTAEQPEPAAVLPVALEAPAVLDEAAELPASPAAQVVRPRRPLSFHELNGIALQPQGTPVEQAHQVESAPEVEPAPAVSETPENVAETTPQPELAAPVLDEPAPQASSYLQELALAAPVPDTQPEQHFGEEAVVREAEPVAPRHISWRDQAAYGVSDLSSPSIQAYRPSYPEKLETSGPLPTVAQEEFEPELEAASQPFRTGRWDPIPPLRSSGGWRDRPSPVPPSRVPQNVAARRWTGVDADETPARWTPDEPVAPEALPEPLLTRQWGLLSRFQQAKLTSSRSGGGVATESDPEMETAKPSDWNDNGSR